MSKQFIAKSWSGYSDINGQLVWTDGTNIYLSEGYNQYVLDKSTSTWSEKTWNGLERFDGVNIWTDGENIYYSSTYYGGAQRVLNKSTDTWEEKTWTGLTSFNGRFIWTDGDNIYYSLNSNQYVLDKTTSTWSTKTWNGLTSFNGQYIWTDGTDIYYSYESAQYVLDKSTFTWSAKTWTGLTSFNGGNIWADGDNIYYSNYTYDAPNQYILDKSTSTWERTTWTGLTSFSGEYIWKDGDNIYYSATSGDGAQYELIDVPQPNYLSKIVLPINVEGTVTDVEFTIKDAEAREMIENLGHTLYWIGVTTTVLTDGATTNPIAVNREPVLAELGGMASYDGSEFVWNGSAWQEFGKNNFGALAFKSSASGTYTPAGSITVTEASDTKTTITPIATVGTLPEAYFTVSGETATFNFNTGTLPTTGTNVDVVTASGARTAAFTGTEATITVS